VTPKPVERTLANGLRVIVAPSGQAAPGRLHGCRSTTGAATTRKVRAGLAAMTANLLTQGTRTRSAQAIATEVERLGAT
jgi:zinc protease